MMEQIKKLQENFKDESADSPIIEFVGLRSKVYSYLTNDDYNSKKNKGIKRSVVEKYITHNDYKKCLFNKSNDSTPISNVDSSLQTHKSISSKFNLKNFSCYEEIDYHLAILKADLSDLAILLSHIYDAGLHSSILK